MRLRVLAAAAAMFAACLVAKADTFRYVVAFNSGGFISTASFDSPFLITTDTTITNPTGTASDPDGNPGSVDHVMIYPTQDFDPTGLSAFVTNTTNFVDFLFFDTPVTTPGVYQDVFGDGSVSITDIPSTVTPEPSSLALLGTGVLGVIGAARRRLV